MTTILLVLLASLLGLGIWQHWRYLRLRRNAVDDHQPLLHPGAAFHAVTLLAHEDADRNTVLASLRALRDSIETTGGGRVVYAGLVPVTMAASTQLENEWSAAAIAQFPSREAFDRHHRSPERGEALASCSRTYTMGFKRSAWQNLLIPLGLGLLRLRDILTRAEPILPFEPLPDEDAFPPVLAKRREIRALDDYRDIREDAVAIINLILPGSKEQRAADNAYTGQMMRGMAEGGYGPTHLASAVIVEGEHRFTRFGVVFYPGIDHMHAMLGSTFMNRIGPGKQLGDTLAVATIPVTSRLGSVATAAHP